MYFWHGKDGEKFVHKMLDCSTSTKSRAHCFGEQLKQSNCNLLGQHRNVTLFFFLSSTLFSRDDKNHIFLHMTISILKHSFFFMYLDKKSDNQLLNGIGGAKIVGAKIAKYFV